MPSSPISGELRNDFRGKVGRFVPLHDVGSDFRFGKFTNAAAQMFLFVCEREIHSGLAGLEVPPNCFYTTAPRGSGATRKRGSVSQHATERFEAPLDSGAIHVAMRDHANFVRAGGKAQHLFLSERLANRRRRLPGSHEHPK